MFRRYRVAGASMLVGALAAAALSGSSCAINQIGLGAGGTGNESPAATCTDGFQNGGETDANCGGPCDPCGDGKACLVAGDCTSGVCKGKVCTTPVCADGAHNGDKTDVDCGGSCATTCADGKSCAKAADCQSGVCTGSLCAVPSCTDGVHNGTETDVDCGSSCATKCSVQWGCKVDADCFSNDCLNGFCFPNSNTSSCFDSVKNLTETDLDCGGGGCPGCGLNKTCVVDSDCAKSDGSKCDPTLKTCQTPTP